VTGNLDWETDSTYTFQVQIRDFGGLMDTATVAVHVTNVPEAPGIVDGEFQVYENVVAAVAGTIPTTNVGAGVPMTWTILEGNTGPVFEIDPTGQLSVMAGQSLNYENIATYSLLVEIITSEGGDTALITVRVGNVNEAPVLSNSTITPGENTNVGTVVGSVTAVDPENNVNGYTIVETGTPFSISNAGVITLASALDYETTPSYTLTVITTDGQYSDTAIVTVNVQNQNEQPVIGNDTLSVTENLPTGAAVATLAATDPENDVPFTWAIVGGDGSSVFQVNASTGAITTKSPLNYEEWNAYDIRVRVTDNLGSASTRTFTISVNDANDLPIVNIGNLAVTENADSGTVVGNVVASDEDDDALTYALTDGGQFFSIDTAGRITVKGDSLINFETDPTILVIVKVGDGTAFSYDTVTVNVGNLIELTHIELVDVILDQDTIAAPDTIWTNLDTVIAVIDYNDSLGEKIFVLHIDENGDTTLTEKWIEPGAEDSASVSFVVIYNVVDPQVSVEVPGVGTTPLTNTPYLDSTGTIWTNNTSQPFDLLSQYVDQRLHTTGDSLRTTRPITDDGSGFSLVIVGPDGRTATGLQEGENLVIVRYTDVYGNVGSDTLRVMLDTEPPVVQIINPIQGDVFERLSTPVDWKLNGVLQDTLTQENLILGDNYVIRSHTDFAGNTAADTVKVVVIAQGNEVKITVENALVDTKTSEEVITYVTDHYGDLGLSQTPEEIAQNQDYAVTIRNQTSLQEELLFLQAGSEQANLTGNDGTTPGERPTFESGEHIGITMVIDLNFPLSSVEDADGNLQGVLPDTLTSVATDTLLSFLQAHGVDSVSGLLGVHSALELAQLLGSADAVTDLEQLLHLQEGSLSTARDPGSLSFQLVTGGEQVRVVRMVAMWNLAVQDIRLNIFDNLGQYVQTINIPGFAIDDPAYQNEDGSVRIYVELLPKIQDGMVYGTLTDHSGRSWGTGAFLIKGLVRTTATPAEECADCRVQRFSEEVVKRVGYQRRE
jgi:hypothetical protein